MTRDQANQIISEHESMVVLCTYNILFTNDIVIGRVIEAVDAVKHSPLYRQRTKQYVNRVADLSRKYERQVNQIVGDRSQFFADANDIFLAEVNRHIDTLYWCIKREFDKYKLPFSDTLAKMELARTLCDFSCTQFDKRIQELCEKDNRFNGLSLDYIKQEALLHALNETMRTFNIPCTVDLNTQECISAINALSQKLADGEIIAKAISA